MDLKFKEFKSKIGIYKFKLLKIKRYKSLSLTLKILIFKYTCSLSSN